MTGSERTLSAALNDLADHAPSGPPPTGDLLRRGRRRRHARTAFTSAAAVTGVGVLAALTTGGTHAGTSPDAATGATANATSQSPITLSLAAENTDARPFHFSITSTSKSPGDKGSAHASTSLITGAFDPLTRHGYVESSSGKTNAETIQIGDTCYAQPVTGATWLMMPCTPTSSTTIVGLTQNPAAALEMLEADGQATRTGQTGSGSSALETWKFTIAKKPQASAGSIEAGYTLAGTASVGVDSGEVTAIDGTLTLDPGQVLQGVTNVSITFSDYGAPVNVSAPVAGSTGADAQ